MAFMMPIVIPAHAGIQVRLGAPPPAGVQSLPSRSSRPAPRRAWRKRWRRQAE